VLDSRKNIVTTVITGNRISFKMEYESLVNQKLNNLTFAISIYGSDGTFYSLLGNEFSGGDFKDMLGSGSVSCIIDRFPLTSGRYALNITISQKGIMQDWIKEAHFINVEDGDYYGTGRLVPSTHRCVLIDNTWLQNP